MNTCHSTVFGQMMAGVEPRRMWLPDPADAFETQRRRLKEAGLAPIHAFDHLAGRLPSNGPILLVPAKPREVDWVEIMGLIRLEHKKGKSMIEPYQYKHLKDKVEDPGMPTMQTNIDYGVDCRNLSGLGAFDRIRAAGRIPFHMWSVCNLVFQYPPVLNYLFPAAAGSTYREICVPGILTMDFEPWLDSAPDDIVRPVVGFPSSAEVLK